MEEGTFEERLTRLVLLAAFVTAFLALLAGGLFREVCKHCGLRPDDPTPLGLAMGGISTLALVAYRHTVRWRLVAFRTVAVVAAVAYLVERPAGYHSILRGHRAAMLINLAIGAAGFFSIEMIAVPRISTMMQCLKLSSGTKMVRYALGGLVATALCIGAVGCMPVDGAAAGAPFAVIVGAVVIELLARCSRTTLDALLGALARRAPLSAGGLVLVCAIGRASAVPLGPPWFLEVLVCVYVATAIALVAVVRRARSLPSATVV